MKKPLSETPRTDAAEEESFGLHNNSLSARAAGWKFARKLERELNELKAIHKTALLECRQYTPERWKEICDVQEPAAVWLDGKQMTELMKDKERLDWLIDNASISMLRKDEDGEEWWVELSYSEAREDIDEEMWKSN